MRTGVSWLEERDHGPLFFGNRQIFGKFNVSSENFLAFAVGKDIGFEFYRKVLELAPLLYRCSSSITDHLRGLVPVAYEEMETRRMPHFFHLFLFNLIFTHDSNLSAE